jgi:hypothetical protein
MNKQEFICYLEKIAYEKDFGAFNISEFRFRRGKNSLSLTKRVKVKGNTITIKIKMEGIK